MICLRSHPCGRSTSFLRPHSILSSFSAPWGPLVPEFSSARARSVTLRYLPRPQRPSASHAAPAFSTLERESAFRPPAFSFSPHGLLAARAPFAPRRLASVISNLVSPRSLPRASAIVLPCPPPALRAWGPLRRTVGGGDGERHGERISAVEIQRPLGTFTKMRKRKEKLACKDERAGLVKHNPPDRQREKQQSEPGGQVPVSLCCVGTGLT